MTSENASSQPTDAPAGGSSGADTFSEMVGTIDDFAPGFMKLAKIAGRRVVVACTNSGIHAFDNACPDQGYGLATGSLDGEVITCQWHNWKFDVATGTCLRGEQDVASHPISIRGNEVWVSVTEPSDADKRAALWPSLRRGIEADYVGQIARDTARLLEAGAEPADIVWEAIAVGAPKADYGIGHELAAAADCLAMVDMFDGLDRTLPLTHAIAGIAEETRDRPAYVPSAPRPGDFLAAVEAEHHAGLFGRAAAVARQDAIAPMIAVDPSGTLLDKFEGRVPDQRAIGEDPDIRPRGARRHGRNPRFSAFLIT